MTELHADRENGILVSTGGYAYGVSPMFLETMGLGSCVAMCLYDLENRTGVLAHIVQPSRLAHHDQEHSMTYTAEFGVGFGVNTMLARGSQRHDLVAKLVGGGNMWPGIASSKLMDIGILNLEAVETRLEGEGVPIIGCATGGDSGRSARFDLSNGTIRVEMYKSPGEETYI